MQPLHQIKEALVGIRKSFTETVIFQYTIFAYALLTSRLCIHFLFCKGLVRFKTPKSVDRAMRKFLIEEIVVQDVAVQVKVLSPNKSGDAAFRSGTPSQLSNGGLT